MRTARSSSHQGGLHQAPPRAGTPGSRPPPEQAPPGTKHPPGTRSPRAGTPLGPDTPRTRTPQEETPPWDKTPPLGPDGGTPPAPVNRITDACENITFPQLRCGR